MKLILEHITDTQFLAEEHNGEKQFYLKGTFLQSEITNRNKRFYPAGVMERAAEKYNTEHIKEERALGELGHPEGPNVILKNASHKILELTKEGHNYRGTAIIMDTPNGEIAKSLIRSGVKLGVSSRGCASLEEDCSRGCNVVQDDFFLTTAADIVHDPSAPHAFVEGVLEGKEYIWDNGVLKEENLLDLKTKAESINRDKETQQIKLFEDFLNKL